MVSAGSYILSAALLAVLALSLGFSALRLRQRLLPAWEGAPARLVESILGVALLIWLAELLGVLHLLYAGSLIATSLLLATTIAWALRGTNAPSAGGTGQGGARTPSPAAPPLPGDRTRGQAVMSLIALAAVAVVVAQWALTVKAALDRGIFNFDSLWYHMPFAVEIAQSHSVTVFHHTETVFTNWFYPQNSELLHSVGVLLSGHDTLSLFLNLGWLAVAFLAAWCVGRPYGRGPLAVVAVAVVLACHTLVVREPGAAKNDLMAAALLLAAIAVLLNAWEAERRGRQGGPAGRVAIPPGWPLAVAGLAVGLAAGTKSTALAMAVALTVAAVVLAPAGRRLAASGYWWAAALAGGGFWYLRNLLATGNPLPQVESLGPIPLPHPDRLQSGRPDFSIVHYATDTGVWSEYFEPGLHQAFGLLWPLVVGGAVLGGLLALRPSRPRAVRWAGAVALLGLLAYLFTPLSAAGAEGAPVGFAINIRYAIPALLAGLALLALAGVSEVNRPYGRLTSGTWALLGGFVAVLVVTDRADVVLRDPDRLFAWAGALLFVLIPAALLLARSRGLSRGAVAGGFAVLALLVVVIGYPVQRDYLRDRFANADAETAIPGMRLDSAYRWARDVEGARIGLAGTTAGFLEYGFYGTELTNRVRYLGRAGPHGAFNAIPTCSEFRAAVNAAGLDYLVTSPFLNFIHPGEPVESPEAGWLRGEPAVTAVDRSGPVTVWRVEGRLDPAACGPRNAPLRRLPAQPVS